MQSFDTRTNPDLPDLDDHLVEPGTPYEMYDGELVHVAPAKRPHAMRHAKVCALVEAHVRREYYVAADLLTRTSKIDDIAPDVCVAPCAPDPVTGRRQLAELVIEVVSKQRLICTSVKAEKLAMRGVRRVFAIDVKRRRALEWSAALATWTVLDSTSFIEDAVLEAPLPVAPLLTAAKADDAMAKALIQRRNPVIEAAKADSRAEGHAEGKREGRAEGKQEGHAEGKQEGHAEGKQEGRAEGHAEGKQEGRAEGHAEGKQEGRVDGMRESVLALLAARGIPVDAAARARIEAEQDLAPIRRWLVEAAQCTCIDDVLVEP